jgi:ABC-2 type transport system permease protein
MLIAVFLVALAYNGIMLITNRMQQKWFINIDAYYGTYDDQIARLKSSKSEGWETQVEILTYLKDNDIPQNYLDDDHWMQTAVYAMFDKKDEAKAFSEAGETKKADKALKTADEFEKAVAARDWKAYNRANVMVAQANLDNNDYSGVKSTYWRTDEYFEVLLWRAQYQAEHEIPPIETHWKNRLLSGVMSQKCSLVGLTVVPEAERDREAIAKAERKIMLWEYRLENDIRVDSSEYGGITSQVDDSSTSTGFGFWRVFAGTPRGITFISVMIIIIAGSVISSEFSTGTIKYLLVNPVKRYKIFIAKYVSVLSFAFLMLFAYYLFNVLLSGLIFGFDDLGAPYLYVSNGEVAEGSSFLFVASKYLIASVGMICMATLSFAVSSLARSSALSIGLGVFLYLSGYSVAAVMSGLDIDFGRYIIFANLELNEISEGISLFKGQTLTFAIAVIGVYMTVFLLTAWDGFVRRDVK